MLKNADKMTFGKNDEIASQETTQSSKRHGFFGFWGRIPHLTFFLRHLLGIDAASILCVCGFYE